MTRGALLTTAVLLATACDARDETFATAAELAELVEGGWVPPLPEGARQVRVAWDLDRSTSFFCGEAWWEDIRSGAPAEDAALPEARPEGAPDWWWEEARLGTETLDIAGPGERGWTLTRTAPGSFCGADAASWRG